MTVAEAAAALGVNESTIRYRIGRKAMQAERIGKRTWIIPITEVERWKDIGKVRSGRPPQERSGTHEHNS